MKKLHLDFETRSVADVKVVGPYRYATDPSTTVLCLCYKYEENGQIIARTIKKSDFNKRFDNVVMNGEMETCEAIKELIKFAQDKEVRFLAHNSMFEYCMWNFVLTSFGFPDMKNIDRWECTASKAAAHALPRALGKCARALHLSEDKDETGKRVMLALSKPKKPSKKDPTLWNNDPDKFNILYAYCEQDVIVETAIDNALPPLRAEEREVWKLDQAINLRGIKIDTDALDIAIQFTNRFKDELNAELMDLTSGKVAKATEVKKLTEYLRDFVDESELPNLNAANLKEYLKTCTDPKIKRILEIRQQAGKSSTTKLERMKQCLCKDGRVHDILVYHGTSTGRWAGAGIQVQNFPRGSEEYDIDNVIDTLKLNDFDAFTLIYPNVVDAISAALRGFLIADEDEELVAADFSSIESRVLFWLSQCKTGLQAYLDNADIYCLMASEIYKRKITKKDKNERQVGKHCVLGCGYQMGAARFKEHVKTLAGMDIPESTAKLAVGSYRATFPEVVAFWYAQERAAIKAVREAGRLIKEGPIAWGVHGQFLYCRLPSGRCIAYADPIIKPIETKWGEIKEQLTFMAVNSLTKNWERQHTYGGSLTENIVQGTARDLMVYSMQNLEKAGYKTRMTVHDEIVSSIQKGLGNVEQYEKIMAQTPAWATNCPVKAEGWSGIRYRK